MDNTKNIGDFGEISACSYLKHHGYKIVERNYSNKYGEIDIIAQKQNRMVFVEVKTRSGTDFGNPSDAVDFRKQNRITNTAKLYIVENELDLDFRFDIIEVFYKQSVFGGFKTVKINHYENAF